MLTFTSVEFLTAPINNIFANVGLQTKVQYILKYQDINVFVRIAKDIYVFRNTLIIMKTRESTNMNFHPESNVISFYRYRTK